MPKFIMMIGLPGSGKSTYAEKLAKEYDATVFSSDALRKELYGSEAVQDHNEEVFNILMDRMIIALEHGENVIFDAMNINSKNRRHTLKMVGKRAAEKWAVIVATPYELCLKRNNERERHVPEHVIKRAYMNFTVPCWQEGFTNIDIIYPDHIEFKEPFDMVYSMETISHENPHHTSTIGNHMNNALRYFYDNYINQFEKDIDHTTALYAIYLHDIGKPFTKTFINYKGEKGDTAHYYNHNNAGAYDVLFSSIHEDIKIDVALLIQYHMHYYISWKESKKAEKRDKEFLGERLSKMLDILHDCDLNAH